VIRISKGATITATAVKNSNLENAMPSLKIVNGNANLTIPQPIAV
jgi:hypothetical protein